MDESRTDVPMIPKHQAEMEKMHLISQNGGMRTLAIIAIAIIAVVCIATAWANVEMSKNYVSLTKTFVDNYTSRTEKWLETFVRMSGGSPEVLNEKTETRSIQQPSVP